MNWSRSIAVAASLVAISCGDGTGGPDDSDSTGNNGGKGDNAEGLVGEVHNEAGRNVDFTQLQDPIAKFVLRTGDSLPGGFAATIDKLREFDNENCDASNPRAGMTTFVVSETAQILDTPTNYRTVTARACGGRAKEDLLFSLFGVQPTGDLPDSAEVIAFDESSGVYNYYEVSGGRWEFFGDSNDFLHGEGGRCVNCHTSGSLVMKELDTPWVHWEGHHTTPGAKALVDANENLGSHGSSAATLESMVKSANRRWNSGTRFATLAAEQDVRAMLEPLFCTVEVNLDNGADFATSKLTTIKGDFLFDPHLKSSFAGNINMSSDVYEQAITDAGQTVAGTDKKDTIFAMTFPERSNVDNNWIDVLEDNKVVDEAFVKDVLAVDFTRPLFSQKRCSLLEFAPSADQLGDCCRTCSSGQACGDSCISATASCEQPSGCACGATGPLTADRIRDGFIENLAAASPAEGTPEAELLASLRDPASTAAHDARVNSFLDACKSRDQAAFMADIMQVLSASRRQARRLSVFEFEQTMADDRLSPSPTAHLSPDNCELLD